MSYHPNTAHRIASKAQAFGAWLSGCGAEVLERNAILSKEPTP